MLIPLAVARTPASRPKSFRRLCHPRRLDIVVTAPSLGLYLQWVFPLRQETQVGPNPSQGRREVLLNGVYARDG
jgi:hypothetical protein